jgi:shikimate dehydrogenase
MSHQSPLGTHLRQLGILGYPIGQSLSPVMHNQAFGHQQMNCRYSAFAVPPEALAEAIAGIRALGFLGINLTIPHKEAVMPLLDEVSPTARHVGAVNTVVNRKGRLVGYNTDGWGFISSLEEAGVRPAGRHAVVLGAGGASRAVAVHLAMAGVESLTISNRTRERAEAVAEAASASNPLLSARAVQAGSAAERASLSRAELVVNCTPLGMGPGYLDQTPLTEIALLPVTAVVYDTVYHPTQTRLLREARCRGLLAIEGLGMLVHQGACAWEYWFGRRGPVAVMQAAVRSALEGGG